MNKKKQANGKPQTFNGDLSKLPKSLEHLKQQRVWVCWNWKWKKGKWTKPPFRADNPNVLASTSNPKTWGSYEMALKQVLAGKADGLGPTVKGSSISGIDLDDCVDPVGAIAPWAQAYLDRFPTAYREVTVSGKGLRILGLSEHQNFAPKFKGNGVAVELFAGSNHYLTLSCNEIGKCKVLPSIGEQMTAIAAELGNGKRKKDKTQHNGAAESDDDVASDNSEMPWSFANENRLRSALAAIPTDEQTLRDELGSSHITFVNIGRAIERLDWGKRGFDVWRGWCSQNEEKYNVPGLQTQWESFQRTRDNRENPVTIKTVFFYAHKFWSDPHETVEFKIERKPADKPADKLSKSDASAKQTKPKAVSDAVELVCAADVKVRNKNWIWEGHLLRGALELMTGQPDVGKSQTQIHFMACATGGLPWPDGAPAIEPMNVIMVTAEDAIDTDVVPRLMAAGADLKRVHILKCIRTDKLKRQFLLAEDLEKLEQVMIQMGNVGLICIDPITAYMGGKMDSHKTTEVRSQLGPLKDFSERNNVAISAITHPAKNAGARAIDHFIGSQAFIAAARIGHACFEETDEEGIPTGRILFTNVSGSGHRKMPTLAYRIEGTDVSPEPFIQIETSRVVWDKKAINVSANQAATTAKGKTKAKDDEAPSEVMDFLRMMIDAGGGWGKQKEIAAQGKALGFSDKEMRTARKKLAVVSKRKGGSGDDGWWEWGWEGNRPVRF
jgi:putative DNA primase/helicase